MSGGIKRAPRQHTHDQIPRRALRDARLSYRARGVLARLLTNADDYSMTAEDLARGGREGRGAVLSALRELREAGYVRTTKTQDPGGRWITLTWVFEAPEDAPTAGGSSQTGVGFPDSGFPDSGPPDVGSPAAKSRESTSSTRAAAASTSDLASRAGSAAAAPVKKRQGDQELVCGVEIWTQGDRVKINSLIDSNGVEAVHDVAQFVQRRDGRALPSAVAKELTVRVRAAKKQTDECSSPLVAMRARKQALAADPGARARSKAAAAAALAELGVALGVPSGEGEGAR